MINRMGEDSRKMENLTKFESPALLSYIEDVNDMVTPSGRKIIEAQNTGLRSLR